MQIFTDENRMSSTLFGYTCFYFLFLTDDGDTLRYEVDEETYLSIEEKTEGTVGVVGEQFFGFCPDDTVN